MKCVKSCCRLCVSEVVVIDREYLSMKASLYILSHLNNIVPCTKCFSRVAFPIDRCLYANTPMRDDRGTSSMGATSSSPATSHNTTDLRHLHQCLQGSISLGANSAQHVVFVLNTHTNSHDDGGDNDISQCSKPMFVRQYQYRLSSIPCKVNGLVL